MRALSRSRLAVGTAALVAVLLGLNTMALAPPPADSKGWYTVRIRVSGQKCTVTVDRQPPRDFDLPWMVGVDPWLKPYYLSHRGAVGVWVQNGMGLFRNATIKALPGEE